VVWQRDDAGAEADVARALRGGRDEQLGAGNDLETAGVVLAASSVSWAFASMAAGRLMIRTSYRLSASIGGLWLVAGSGGCSGKLTLSAAKRMQLGSARFRIAAGSTRNVTVKLTKAGRKLLARKRKLRARAVVAASNAAGVQRTSSGAVQLVAEIVPIALDVTRHSISMPPTRSEVRGVDDFSTRPRLFEIVGTHRLEMPRNLAFSHASGA